LGSEAWTRLLEKSVNRIEAGEYGDPDKFWSLLDKLQKGIQRDLKEKGVEIGE